MSSDLKIQIKRVGNGYLVSKNFNEKVVMIEDSDMMETRGLRPDLLALCSSILLMIGEESYATEVCFSRDTLSCSVKADGTGSQHLTRRIETLDGMINIDHSHSDEPPKFGSSCATTGYEAGGFMYECSKCMHQWVYAGDAIHPVCPECKSKKTAPADLG